MNATTAIGYPNSQNKIQPFALLLAPSRNFILATCGLRAVEPSTASLRSLRELVCCLHQGDNRIGRTACVHERRSFTAVRQDHGAFGSAAFSRPKSGSELTRGTGNVAPHSTGVSMRASPLKRERIYRVSGPVSRARRATSSSRTSHSRSYSRDLSKK